MSAPVRSQLWRPGDTPAVLVLNAFAGLGVVGCWFGSAKEATFHSTLYWLQGAIVAAVLAACANGLWLLTGMRQLRARRRALVEGWPRVPAAAYVPDEAPVVTADRMTTYHRPGCLLVQGKPVRSGSAHALVRRQLTPCGMCQP